jgi:hypothetical protein
MQNTEMLLDFMVLVISKARLAEKKKHEFFSHLSIVSTKTKKKQATLRVGECHHNKIFREQEETQKEKRKRKVEESEKKLFHMPSRKRLGSVKKIETKRGLSGTVVSSLVKFPCLPRTD